MAISNVGIDDKNDRPNDIVTNIPSEIAINIFNMLPKEDIFGNCSLVSRRWNNFLNSSAFWQFFLRREFQNDQVLKFLSSCGADFQISRFFHEILKIDAQFSQTEVPSGYLEVAEPFETVEAFLASISPEEWSNEVCRNELFSRNDWNLVNLLPLIGQCSKAAELAFDCLQLHFMFDANFTFYLVDNNGQVVEECRRESCDKFWTFSSNFYKAGVRYVATRCDQFRMSLGLPSTVDKLSKYSLRDTDDLRRAIERKNTCQLLKILEKKQPYLEHGTKTKPTPLALAARNGNLAILKLLLESGAKVEGRDLCYQQTYSALAAASSTGQLDCMRYLISEGANVNGLSDEMKSTAIQTAIRFKQTEAIFQLVEQGADPTLEDKYGRNALHYAAAYYQSAGEANDSDGDVEDDGSLEIQRVFEALLAKGCQLESRAKVGGFTPLMAAASDLNLEGCRLLLRLGAKTRLDGTCALAEALEPFTSRRHHQKAVVQLLLEADREQLECQGRESLKPLQIAFRDFEHGHFDLELFKMLIANGAEVNVESYDKRFPNLYFHAMAEADSMRKAAKALVKSGRLDLTVRDDRAYCPLMAAALASDYDIMELLLDSGIKTDCRNYKGETALMLACKGHPGPQVFIKQRLAVLERLCGQSLAHLNLQDESGRTALHHAALRAQSEMIKFLLRLKADSTLKDKNGAVAQQLARPCQDHHSTHNAQANPCSRCESVKAFECLKTEPLD